MKQTKINLTYEGVNISEDISPFLLSFSYTDNSGDKSDDLSISLEDRTGLWFNSWLPSKGDKIIASIEAGNSRLPCGNFEVDQIEYSAPPRVLSIKGVSCAVSKKAAKEKHNRAWENARISDIARDVAGNAGLSLYYDSPQDYFFERKEQARQSDLEFLRGLCGRYGLNVKVNDGKLIVYEVSKQEAQASAAEIRIDDYRLISYRFSSKTAGVYSGAKVKYHNASKGRTFEAEISDDSTEGTQRILELHERVESESDARALAEKKLQAANKREISGNITLTGDIRFLAGVNITLSDFGIFSGKYSVTKAVHSVTQSGYTTSLELQMGSSEKKKSKEKKKAKQSKVSSVLYYEGDKYYKKGE